MKLAVLTVRTAKASWLEELAQVYEGKIKPFVPFESIHVKPKTAARDDREWKKQHESQAILSEITARDFVFVCDETGRAFDSKNFSKQLVRGFESGKARVVFVVGGAYGLTDDVLKRGDVVWKLSDMTLSHWIAQAVIYEQIFRGLSIWKNRPYHND